MTCLVISVHGVLCLFMRLLPLYDSSLSLMFHALVVVAAVTLLNVDLIVDEFIVCISFYVLQISFDGCSGSLWIA